MRQPHSWPVPVARSVRAAVALAVAVLLGAGVATAALTTGVATAPAGRTTAPAGPEAAGESAAPGDARGGPDGEDAAPAAPIACEDARNHGAYVSSAARSTPPGPGKGATVSAAARSDCGKPPPSTDGDAEEPSTEGGESGPPLVPPGLAKKGLTEPPGRAGQPTDAHD